jgi:hypothetical protein
VFIISYIFGFKIYFMFKYLALILGFVLISCSTSQNVNSGSIVQKRKYTKGYHVSLFAKKQEENGIEKIKTKDFKKLDSLLVKKLLFASDTLIDVENMEEKSISTIVSNDLHKGSNMILKRNSTAIMPIRSEEKPSPNPEKPNYDKSAKKAYLYGIISIFVLRVIFGILAIYYGIKAIDKINSGQIEEFNRKKAVTGILLGFFMLIFTFLYYYILFNLLGII